MSCIRSFSVSLALAFVFVATLRIDAQEKSSELKREPHTEWWCKIYRICVCYDPERMEYGECGITEHEGTGASESEACEDALSNCQSAKPCDDGGEPECCYNSSSEFCDGYPHETMNSDGEVREIKGEKVWKSYRDVKYWVLYPKQDLTRYEFSGVGERDGRRISIGALDRALAWRVFNRAIDARNGLRPGTLKLRMVPPWFYHCYVRVQSTSGNTIYNQEVESTSTSVEEAKIGAIDLAQTMKVFLENAGHESVQISPSIRCVRTLNTFENACKDSVLCRIKCTTVDSTFEIQTSRYDHDHNSACAAAREAAINIADEHGGSGECMELPSERLASDKPCVGCSSSAAEAVPTEDPETN